MKTIFPLSLLFLLGATFSVIAGGDSYRAEIIDLVSKENNQYVLVLKQHSIPYGQYGNDFLPRTIVIHLRYNETLFGTAGTGYTSPSQFEEAIKTLIEFHQKGEEIRFGVIGRGYILIDAEKNEYQSNALSVFTEADGARTVFSFAGPL